MWWWIAVYIALALGAFALCCGCLVCVCSGDDAKVPQRRPTQPPPPKTRKYSSPPLYPAWRDAWPENEKGYVSSSEEEDVDEFIA